MTAPVWVRSSACNADACVEVAAIGDKVMVRDSKLGKKSPVLEFDSVKWEHVLTDVCSSGEVEHFRFWPLRFTDDEKVAFVAGVKLGVFDLDRLTAEWQAAVSDSAVLTSEATTEPRSSVSVDSGRVSGLVVSDDHPAVQAVLAVTPMNPTAVGPAVIVGFYADDSGNAYPKLGDPAPLAAKQTAAVLRWLADTWKDGWHNSYDLARLADEIAGSVATHPTTEGDQNR